MQAQLASNRVTRKHDQILRHANFLGGLLFDGLGRRMKSSQAAKGAKRYHHYGTAVDAVMKVRGVAWRVPAHDTEMLVIGHVREFLCDRHALQNAAARAANTAMHAARDMSVAEVAKAQGFTNNYFTLLLRLATLAPSIVQAIIAGRHPPD